MSASTNGKSEGNGESNKTDVAAILESNNSDLADIIFTVDFAAQKHATQRRKDPEKTPYVNHPIGKKKCLQIVLLIYDWA